MGVKRMFSWTKKMAIISTFLVVGFGVNSQVKAFDSAVGEWTYRELTIEGHTMRGKMTFIDKTNATYTANNGRIIFVATDGDSGWKGFWIEEGSDECPEEKYGSKLWGTAIFYFNDDYSKFEGTWDMCGNGIGHSWTGFR
jgi:hypothetical protein